VTQPWRGRRAIPVVLRERHEGVELLFEIRDVEHGPSGPRRPTIPEETPNRKDSTGRCPGRGDRLHFVMDAAFRDHVARALSWAEAHMSLDDAVAGLPAKLRGRVPDGLPYSPWQLLEHIRITQHDILDFCRNPAYEEMKWPDDYWPKAAEPPSAKAWDESLRRIAEDRTALEALARDASVDLAARIPHGTGQTYLREILLVIDHTAYHLGELIVVRRLLGAWPR